MKTTRKHILPLLAAIVLFALACGKDSNPGAADTGLVTNPYPLSLGNSWEYSLQQDAFIKFDSTIVLGTLIDTLTGELTTIDTTVTYVVHFTSLGNQKVTVTRTEAITGDEAFGLHYFHVMNFVFTEGADTTEEIHYLAPRGDKLLLKAITSGYNTGGFIPFGQGADAKPRLLAKVTLDGRTRYVPLERLAGALLNPEPTENLFFGSGTSLASDGVQNDENSFFYDYDYILLYDELYKGRNWVSSAAQGVGGLEISRKVTNILPDLSGYEGPIAEVEETNSLIESVSTLTYKLRYYFKGGVGIVQAEISDSDFDFFVQTEDGIVYLGTGTWQVVKKLTGYTVK